MGWSVLYINDEDEILTVQASKSRRPTSLASNTPLCEVKCIVARLFLPSLIFSTFNCTTVRSTSIAPFLADTLKFFRVSFCASVGRKDVGTARVGSITHDPLTPPFDLEMTTKLLGGGGGGMDGDGNCPCG